MGGIGFQMKGEDNYGGVIPVIINKPNSREFLTRFWQLEIIIWGYAQAIGCNFELTKAVEQRCTNDNANGVE
jgi:hypothetical protein